MEKAVKFIRFQQLKQQALAICQEVLALIGDSVFTFYVRMRLLPVSSHVQVIHTIAAKMVSAVMQAKAMHVLETGLSEQEAAIVHRGRNAKSMVPKSASVSEYRAATAFEALCGWLLVEYNMMKRQKGFERGRNCNEGCFAETYSGSG